MTSPNVTLLNPSPAPGTPEWRRIMTASKIAAVVGLSPYESRFHLWHSMAGQMVDEQESDAMAEGTIFEPAIRQCFRRKHPQFRVTDPDGMRVREDSPWLGATVDGLVFDAEANADAPPVAVLECKRSQAYEAWGTPGTDEIPNQYFCQVQTQMYVTDIRRAYVAAEICGRMTYYVVDYCHETAQALIDAAAAFMATLPGQPGERRPELDSDASTLECIRKLHPGINRDEKVQIGNELNAQLVSAKAALEEAKAADRHAKAQVLDLMGDARIGTAGGVPVVRRQPSGKAIALHVIKPQKAKNTDGVEAA